VARKIAFAGKPAPTQRRCHLRAVCAGLPAKRPARSPSPASRLLRSGAAT